MNMKPDWSKRKNITLPADLADGIIKAAQDRGIPVYRLVNEAVKTWALLHPVNGKHDADA